MEELVKLARETVEKYMKTGKLKIKEIEKFKGNGGVFVSIHTFPDHQLRGCIGFPYPDHVIYKAVQVAAIEAAFEDSRFPPLTKDELGKIAFEVSVLTNPKEVSQKEIKNGDGIIIENGLNKGLFLPQVWEQLSDKKSFLSNLCWKAGLPESYLQDKNTKFYRFSVEAFAEVEPRGKIVKIKV
jgi:hypothetical protein